MPVSEDETGNAVRNGEMRNLIWLIGWSDTGKAAMRPLKIPVIKASRLF
jgi:hypothetical protein